jgi:hypothetical protein
LVSTTVRCGFMIAHPAVLTWSRVTARRMARHALWEQRTLVKTFGPRGVIVAIGDALSGRPPTVKEPAAERLTAEGLAVGGAVAAGRSSRGWPAEHQT